MPSLMTIFTPGPYNILAFDLRVLEALNDKLEGLDGTLRPLDEGVKFGDLIDYFRWKFALEAPEISFEINDHIRRTVASLQRIKTVAELGLVWCADATDNQVVDFDSLDVESQLFLTPAGKYVCEVLATKREYIYWAFLSTEGCQLPYEYGSQVPYVDSCSEQFRIETAAYACRDYLTNYFKAEADAVRSRLGNSNSNSNYFNPKGHLFLRIIQDLIANIRKSEALTSPISPDDSLSGRFMQHITELDQLASDFRSFLTPPQSYRPGT
jgi:hypothetical protein